MLTSKVNFCSAKFPSIEMPIHLQILCFNSTAILQDIEQYKDVLQRGPEASETSNNGDSTEEKPGASSTSAAVGGAGHWRKRLLQKVQTALIESLEIGDEKLQLVQSMQDAVEIKSRQLETDCQALGDKSKSFKYININTSILILICLILFSVNNFTEFNKEREGNENLKESSNNREVGGGAGGSSSGGNAGSGGERQSKRARRTRPDNVNQLFIFKYFTNLTKY